MLLETVAFPFGGEKKTDASFLDRKAETVIESARQLSRFCDVYKAEFPGTLGRESDEQLEDNLHALDAASERPWVLAVGGRRLRRLSRAGRDGAWAPGPRASSAAGPSGRSTSSSPTPRPAPSSPPTTGRQRVAEVDALVRELGTPWFGRYGLTRDDLNTIRAVEGWHHRYPRRPPPPPPSPRPTVPAPGEVY